MYTFHCFTDERDNIVPYPPEMPDGIWSFNPRKGILKVMDDSVPWPKGITLSPDNTTLYVTSTPPSASADSVPPRYVVPNPH